MRMLDSNSTLWAWPQVQANVSTISTENVSRSYIKRAFMINLLKKNASILHSLMKNQVFSALELVMSAVMLLAENITRGIYIAHLTLFPITHS